MHFSLSGNQREFSSFFSFFFDLYPILPIYRAVAAPEICQTFAERVMFDSLGLELYLMMIILLLKYLLVLARRQEGLHPNRVFFMLDPPMFLLA